MEAELQRLQKAINSLVACQEELNELSTAHKHALPLQGRELQKLSMQLFAAEHQCNQAVDEIQRECQRQDMRLLAACHNQQEGTHQLRTLESEIELLQELLAKANSVMDQGTPGHQAVVCAICQHDFAQPAALPCGHVFCTGCVVRQHSCPVCRRPTRGAQPLKLYL